MHINIHKSDSRGKADLGWLKSRHTYSFSSYHNPERMGFGKLRVINDDIVRPAKGFGTHPHKDMEIISIPLSGYLKHKDSMGNEHIIHAGEVQIMSAGTGIQHSEYNNSDTDDVNFLQIWILPKLLGITPRYEQKIFAREERHNELQLIVSPSGKDKSIQINQEAFLSLAVIDWGQTLNYKMHSPENGVYVFVTFGEISIGDSRLSERDGAEITDSLNFSMLAEKSSELLFIEVPLH